uniref:NADH dehydrogenase subunit 2 n=1 Tax=Verconia nivalis TaxID=1504999 RepID=UPI00226CC76C|nr:NADH dehydrogenase subunit 2 [Verconia nivalis]UZI00340.1 NADH dehydrogenase subunit 2 [Verconia nivalis]
MSSGNILFLLIMFLGPLVSISSSNWIACWAGLELSFLGAIPLLMMDKGEFSLSKEAVIKYFCVQALGSGFLMVGGVMFFMNSMSLWVWDLLFLTGLFMKLGVFPMHFWVPSVIAGLNWWAVFIILVWQKVAPLAFLSNIVENSPWMGEMILVFGNISALVGAIIGLNQTSVRAMLGGSSIAHTGWLCIGVVSGSFWIYFLIYCLSFGLVMLFFLFEEEIMIGFGILGLSGLPPFIMFIGKWSILKSFLYSGYSWFFLILPLFSALISLFFYLNFFYSYYLKFKFDLEKKLVSIYSVVFIIMSGAIYMFFI